MRPPQREFERVPTDNFVNAEIRDIVYDEHHEFNVFQSQEKELLFGVQFVLAIAGLEHIKKTKWFKFSYDKKANLYKLFIAPLVEGAAPYMEFDLDQLKGMSIKMLWKDDEDPRYQSIETVRPALNKIKPALPQPKQPVFTETEPGDAQEPSEEEVPY